MAKDSRRNRAAIQEPSYGPAVGRLSDAIAEEAKLRAEQVTKLHERVGDLEKVVSSVDTAVQVGFAEVAAVHGRIETHLENREAAAEEAKAQAQKMQVENRRGLWGMGGVILAALLMILTTLLLGG